MADARPARIALDRATDPVAVGGGVLHLGLALLASYSLERTARRPVELDLAVAVDPVFLWFLLGMVLLGAIPAVLFDVYRLISPGVVVLVLLTWSFYVTWDAYRTAAEHGYAIAPSLRPFTVYAIGWILPLGLAIAAGLGERAIRRSIG